MRMPDSPSENVQKTSGAPLSHSAESHPSCQRLGKISEWKEGGFTAPVGWRVCWGRELRPSAEPRAPRSSSQYLIRNLGADPGLAPASTLIPALLTHCPAPEPRQRNVVTQKGSTPGKFAPTPASAPGCCGAGEVQGQAAMRYFSLLDHHPKVWERGSTGKVPTCSLCPQVPLWSLGILWLPLLDQPGTRYLRIPQNVPVTEPVTYRPPRAPRCSCCWGQDQRVHSEYMCAYRSWWG